MSDQEVILAFLDRLIREIKISIANESQLALVARDAKPIEMVQAKNHAEVRIDLFKILGFLEGKKGTLVNQMRGIYTKKEGVGKDEYSF